MISFYKRGTVWWAYSTFQNERRRWSLKTRDRHVAQQLCQQAELDLLSGGRLKEVLWPDFELEFLQWIGSQVRPSTFRGYRFSAQRFGRFLDEAGIHLVRDITPATLAEFTTIRRADIHPSRKRPMTDGGIRFDLRILRRVFNYAIECGYLQANPVRTKNLNAVAGKTKPFSRDEVASMLAQAETPLLRALVVCFLCTGLRIGDVITLRKTDVAGTELRIQTRKRNTAVSIHIHLELRKALDAHLTAQNPAQADSEYLFSSIHGRPLVGLDKVLRRLWTRAGITGGHAHRFRDTMAIALLEKGASLYDVAKLLGNSARVVELHYAPYCRELQERGQRLISGLDFVSTGEPK